MFVEPAVYAAGSTVFRGFGNGPRAASSSMVLRCSQSRLGLVTDFTEMHRDMGVVMYLGESGRVAFKVRMQNA